MRKISPKKFKKSLRSYDKIYGARFSLFILKMFALWPWKSHPESIVQLVTCFVIHVPFSLIFWLLMWVETFISPDLDQTGNVLYLALTFSAHIVKLVNIRMLSKEAKSFMDELQNNTMYDLLTAKEVDIWSKDQKSFRNIVIFYVTTSIFCCVCGFVEVLFDDEYRVGFPYWLPFEWRTPERYWYAYSFDVAAILVTCLTSINLDLLACYMIFHIGLLYKILGLRYTSMRDVKEVCAVKELRKLFLLHASIKRRTKECKVLVSYQVLAHLIFSALIICFSGYRLKNVLNNAYSFYALLLKMNKN